MDEISKHNSFVPLSVPSNSPNYHHDWLLLSILNGSSNPRTIKHDFVEKIMLRITSYYQ